MESDIVEQARKRAISYRACGPSGEHTAAMLDELAFHFERLRAELAHMRWQRDEAQRALKQIAHQDYRGHPSTESQIAMNAIAAMRKEGGGA